MSSRPRAALMATEVGPLLPPRRTGGARPDDALPVFLFYLLVDVSGSMTPDIDRLNALLVEFRDRLRADPVTDDTVLFSVLSFASSARVEVPLGNFADVELAPQLLTAGGRTRYSAAFDLLRVTIERDLAALRARAEPSSRDTFRYYRPAVFFLTDGRPDAGDSWERAFDALKAMKAYPLFVPFGFRDASETALRPLVHPRERSKLYFTRSADVGEVLSEMLDVMFQSIISSATSATTAPGHDLPDAEDVGADVEVQAYLNGKWVSA